MLLPRYHKQDQNCWVRDGKKSQIQDKLKQVHILIENRQLVCVSDMMNQHPVPVALQERIIIIYLIQMRITQEICIWISMAIR